MARNYVQEGKHIPFIAGATTTSGQAVVIGALLGVALNDVANGAAGIAAVEGVWELPKVSTDTFANGQQLTWDVSEAKLTEGVAAEGDLVACCVAVEVAGNGTTTVAVKLTPGTATIEPAA